MMASLRRVAAVGLVWGVLWTAAVMVLVVVIGIVDPDSIDPGEGPLEAAAIFGPMGFLSGVVFRILLSIADRGRPGFGPSPVGAAAWGTLASAIVQLGYLGHGDQGLIANLGMALVFSAFGGLVALAWLVIARRRSRRRSAPTPAA